VVALDSSFAALDCLVRGVPANFRVSCELLGGGDLDADFLALAVERSSRMRNGFFKQRAQQFASAIFQCLGDRARTDFYARHVADAFPEMVDVLRNIARAAGLRQIPNCCHGWADTQIEKQPLARMER
jgi:hypothetical protein